MRSFGRERRFLPGHPRLAKILRRIGITVLVIALVAPLLSLSYNLATNGRASVPPGVSYLQAGDVRTRYRAWGDPGGAAGAGTGGTSSGSNTGGSAGASTDSSAGTPIVLVHGAAESADTWAALGPLLAQRHYVVALDLDGWGYSQRVAPFTQNHQVAQLLAFVAALGLRRPLLVGHSSGAAIVAQAALRDPGAVGGVMFLDGDALSTGAGQRSPLSTLLVPPFRTTLLRLAVRSDALIRAVYSRACGPGCARLDSAGVQQWRRPFQVPGAEAGLFAMFRQGVPGLPATTLAGLARLPFPKAVVFGAQDPVFSRDSPYQTAARIGAPAPTLIPGARHLTMISDPAVVAAAIEQLAARAAASEQQAARAAAQQSTAG